MKLWRRLRFFTGIVAAVLLVAYWGLHGYRRLSFAPVRGGEKLSNGWVTAVLRQERETVYALLGPRGERRELERLSFEGLAIATIHEGAETFLVTRYTGSGSSGADYFSVYRLLPDGVTPVAAESLLDWSSDGPDEPCRETPVRVTASESSTVFGDCGTPALEAGGLRFRMPGFHCSWFQSGGCPTETFVRLR